jgi:hypothetical protein
MIGAGRARRVEGRDPGDALGARNDGRGEPAMNETAQSPMSGPASDVPGVRVPILVSGIFNVLGAIGWALPCITVFLSAPLLALAIFEFLQYGKLGDPARRASALSSTRVIGILEICTILLGNVPSMVCGILVLVNFKQLEDAVRAR